MPKTNKRKIIASSQDFIPVKEIKDSFVILDDGTLVAISLVTSVNISLKTYDEQLSIINSFQSFLNLLEFPVQICIQSRKLDMTAYLAMLEERLKVQINDILKLQTIEYITFIKHFTESVNIMEKQFFLVVSYKVSLSKSRKRGFFSFLSQNESGGDDSSQNVLEQGRAQLDQRVGLLSSGLSRTGVKIKRLDTEAALELFYSIFNQDSGQ